MNSTYYPIPYYAALFKGKWYNIKQLIGIAKETKLRNSAPIKYHIEVGAKYWESIFRAEEITDRRKQRTTTEKVKTDRSVATLGKTSRFYDVTTSKEYEVESAPLTSGECRRVRDCCIFRINSLDVFL